MTIRRSKAATAVGQTHRHALIAGVLLAAVLSVQFANAQSTGTIKIGMVLAKQGASAEQSEYLAQGSIMALEQQGNKILGRPAEIVWLDEPSPLAAQQSMEKLIGEEKVVAVVGGNVSANALAMAAVAKRAKIPYIANNAAATDITGKECNRYTFRVQAPSAVQARALAPFLTESGKNWYFLVASYAFGTDILNSFGSYLKEVGGKVVGTDQVPLNTPDYSSFILKIRQAKPDVVVGGLSSGDLSNFLKQWNEMGMKGKIPFAEIAIGDSDLWSIGPDAATGIFTKPWYYKDPNNSPEEKAFAEAYQKKYKRVAADKAFLGWFAMRTLLGSIENAKSTEPAAIVNALEKWRGKVAGVPIGYREWDHQMLRPLIVTGVKPKITDPTDMLNVLKTVPANAADLDSIFGSKAEVGCQLGPL
jgi:branched-chain amino acid transport system substrate-binding protein